MKPATSIRNTAPTSEIGIATTGMITRAQRAEEQEDDDDDDEQRLGERPEHLVDRVLDVLGRVVRDADLHARPAAAPGSPASPRAPCSITSSEFAVGSTQTPMNVAVSPLKRTSWS